MNTVGIGLWLVSMILESISNLNNSVDSEICVNAFIVETDFNSISSIFFLRDRFH